MTFSDHRAVHATFRVQVCPVLEVFNIFDLTALVSCPCSEWSWQLEKTCCDSVPSIQFLL